MIYFLSPSPEEFRDKAQTEMFPKCWLDILVKTSCAKRSVAIQVEQLDGKHYMIKGIKTNTWSYFKFFLCVYVCLCSLSSSVPQFHTLKQSQSTLMVTLASLLFYPAYVILLTRRLLQKETLCSYVSIQIVRHDGQGYSEASQMTRLLSNIQSRQGWPKMFLLSFKVTRHQKLKPCCRVAVHAFGVWYSKTTFVNIKIKQNTQWSLKSP